jgi:hypothetical protein
MPAAQSKTPYGTNAAPLAPTELFKQCEEAERAAANIDVEKIKLILARQYLFETDHFPPLEIDVDSRQSGARRRRSSRIEAAIWDSNKYHWMLELLRTAQTRSARLLLIAWWLNQEQICAPEEIISSKELRRVARKHFRLLSAAEFRYADMVRTWIPYFDSLRHDLRTLKSPSQLTSIGYDPAAVMASLKKRSSVSAACEWLAQRSHVAAGRLANAYSHLYGPKRRNQALHE